MQNSVRLRITIAGLHPLLSSQRIRFGIRSALQSRSNFLNQFRVNALDIPYFHSNLAEAKSSKAVLPNALPPAFPDRLYKALCDVTGPGDCGSHNCRKNRLPEHSLKLIDLPHTAFRDDRNAQLMLISRMADGSTLNFRSAVMSPLISCCTSETCV